MNPHTKNLNRLEFVTTLASMGRCKHCSGCALPMAGLF